MDPWNIDDELRLEFMLEGSHRYPLTEVLGVSMGVEIYEFRIYILPDHKRILDACGRTYEI